MRWLLACLLVVTQTLSAAAQEDKDRITRFLQDSLSGLGREVTIEGFQGALSSRATMDKLTIADANGVWLTLTDAVLDWNRAAVLGGRIEINEISAAQIDLPRLGASSGSSASPAAGTFALPELPVSLRIDAIKADRVVLGAPVVGLPAVLAVSGAVSLAEGQGTASLDVTRLEGPRGAFSLKAGFSNVTRVLDVDLTFDEAENGLISTLLNLPGSPALELEVKGTGPLEDFTADVVLKSADEDRLKGQISTQASDSTEGDAQAAETPSRIVLADLSGDLTPLFLPQYRAFFGPDIAFQSRVSLFSDGRAVLNNLTLSAAALSLSGDMALSADRLPEQFRLDVQLRDPDGQPVLLPIPGAEIRVGSATLTAGFDSAQGEAWSLTGDVLALQRPEVTMEALHLNAQGTIKRGETRQVTARIDAAATGIALLDQALAEAFGSEVTLGSDFMWRDGQPLDVNSFELAAPGMRLRGSGTVDGLDSAIELAGEMSAEVADIARFSAMAGQSLHGDIKADLTGKLALLTGAFDLNLTSVARDLGIGVDEIDEVLSGDSRLEARAIRDTEGLKLDKLVVTTSVMNLTGNAALAADGLPDHFDMQASLRNANGRPVALPLTGPKARVQSATLHASYDRQQGEAWSLTGDVQQFSHDGIAVQDLQLDAKGTINPGETQRVTAHIDAIARGIALTDAAQAEAVGTEATLASDINWRKGQPLTISGFSLSAPGMALSGAGAADFDNALTIDGALNAQIADVSRFAALTGLPLRGSVTADLAGQIGVADQSFDLELAATARDLAIGNTKLDRLFVGESRFDAAASRTGGQLTLRRAKITASGITAEAVGRQASGDSDLRFAATLKDAAPFVAGFTGAAELSGRAIENATGWVIDLSGTAPRAVVLTAEIALPNDTPPTARFDASIGSLAWIAPELAGGGRISGTAQQLDSQWAVQATADGPGGSQVTVAGQIAQDASSASLGLNGALPLGLLNQRLKPNAMQGLAQFELRLDGPLELASLSGQLRSSGARLALPGLHNALTGIEATVSLAGSNAEIQVVSTVATGGQVSANGRVGLQVPYVTDIALQLANVRITDPQLYETNVNGTLQLSGTAPQNLALAGQLVLDRTEILVPSTGIDAFGEIPDIIHINEPAEVHRTRSYAGLLDVTDAGGTGGGTAIALDVWINAENRIFIRGRGLDAELGGQLRLTGTTADVVPLGRFELIRGRLDILGKRLTLEEGSAQLQGDLIPTLRLVAGTTSDDTVILVIVEGPADAPEISFEAEPSLPEDEVLALLLFGRDITSISALQAVQLASAVATLAGRGGVGIVERMRQNTGLDDLDVTTNTDGTASLKVGKYISENAYTDVEIDSQGQTQINLNLDLTPTTKLRGQVGTDGSTGIGLFFERDY